VKYPEGMRQWPARGERQTMKEKGRRAYPEGETKQILREKMGGVLTEIGRKLGIFMCFQLKGSQNESGVHKVRDDIIPIKSDEERLLENYAAVGGGPAIYKRNLARDEACLKEVYLSYYLIGNRGREN